MISLVVAMDKHRIIGKDNQLPWHLPADLAFFKKVTMGKPIIMGRKTHQSIGRALPGRENIILTRDESFKAKDCTIIHHLDAIKEIEAKHDEVCVIGGAEIFKDVLPLADRLYITEIHDAFEGDTFFPAFDKAEWTLVSSEKGPKDEKNQYDYYFTIYEKR